MRWLMRLLKRTPPPDRSSRLDTPRDPAWQAARQAYQEDKDAALRKKAELIARLNRLGYDLDTIGRRGDRAAD